MSNVPPAEKPVALIAGARTGVCDQIALLLGKVHGMIVLVGTSDERYGEAAVAKLTAAGIEACFVRLKSSDLTSVEAAARWIGGNFGGRLDALINYSDVVLDPPSSRPAASTTFAAIFHTSVNYPFVVSKAMQPLLQRSRAGRIVIVARDQRSFDPEMDPHWESSPYRMLCYKSCRAALQLKTVLFALELAEAGTFIKINTIEIGSAADEGRAPSQASTFEQSAAAVVELATLPGEGPSGKFFDPDQAAF